MKYLIGSGLLFFLFFGCQQATSKQDTSMEENEQHQHGHQHHGGDANAHMNQHDFEDMAAHFESPERAEWQKPDTLIAFLGDLEGKTVMDIGSGTGYFSFRMVKAGAHVISADVDERYLAFIEKRKQEEGVTDEQLEPRKVPYDSANLQPGEADLVFMVNVYHHIEQREVYFAEVRKGLKPGGRLVIVDFNKEELPVGPPPAMKLEPEEVVKELRAAGYTEIRVNRSLLPYQYIVTAD